MGFLTELWRGKDLYRIFLNKECTRFTIKGKTLDVGSGIKTASYHRFLKREKDSIVECLDLGFENSDGKKINLEKDLLPLQPESVDTVLMFNVLEHLYNYQLILSETQRVLKNGGQLVGAVPFLVAYHPDPHDYWRYTKEALEKILTGAGFTYFEIKTFGLGPVGAGFSQIEMVLPRWLKIIFLPAVLVADRLIISMRPTFNHEKFTLGLFFSATK